MILHSDEIVKLCELDRMIVPFTVDQVNPASYDLQLGGKIMVESVASPELVRVDISDCTKEKPYWLPPGAWILAETFETFNMPDDVAGFFFLKSSRAREGFEHSHAGFADPQWNGSRLTLEISNARQLHPLAIYPGLKIGQMVFMLLAGSPGISYAAVGHYNGHASVMPSWEAA